MRSWVEFLPIQKDKGEVIRNNVIIELSLC